MIMKKMVLVTGANSDLGKAIVTKLSNNYNLVLSGRNFQDFEYLNNLCSENPNHLLFDMDLNQVDLINNKLRDFIVANEIEINGFIHCAGYFKLEFFKKSSYELLRNTFNINVLSAIEIIKCLISKKNNNTNLENIIFISSIAAKRGFKGLGYYSAAKSSLLSLSKSMAKEFSPNIRVNSILPGAILTKGTKSIYDRDVVNRDYPLGEGKPEDVANIADFLLSEKSKWITGQEFIIDGGASLL